MASSSGSQKVDIPALRKELYDACKPLVAETPNLIFNQTSILDLDIIPGNDINILLAVTQGLVDEKKFKILQSDTLSWMVRSEEDARKYRSLKPEHEAVYQLVDEAGEDGIWSKTIKSRLGNLHDAVFRAAIKNLESKNMIADMKSVEHPARKMYIKSTLRPSERATGGPWYTDNELDDAFIETIMSVLFRKIAEKSYYVSSSIHLKKPKVRITKKMTPEEVKDARALRDSALGSEDPGAARKRLYDAHLPMPSGYQGYPTLDELTAYVETVGVSSTTLSSAEILQLLDLLCFDEKVEKIISDRGFVYKALRKSLLKEQDLPNNSLTEAPCGRCPVFDLCEEGGPVGPSNCEYFNEWLAY